MIGSSPDIAVPEATDAGPAAGLGGRCGWRAWAWVGRVQMLLASAKSRTCLATGPARRPPVEALISSLTPLIITAIAYFGSPAGANAVIQAFERSGSPSLLSWAVPVL